MKDVIKPIISILFLFFGDITFSQYVPTQPNTLRDLADTVGFARFKWQMDTIFSRIDSLYADSIALFEKQNKLSSKTNLKVLVSPHDDYAYASYMYKLGTKHIHAKTIFLIGVGHKARYFDFDNKIVFDNFNFWRSPYGNIPVSHYRDVLINRMPKNEYIISDSLHKIEHSIEAILPFLQYENRNMEIIPIIVPYMTWKMMKQISRSLANQIFVLADSLKWKWGKDYAIVISTDAVHYGNEGWGGEDLAPFGCNLEGYNKAVYKENEIINNSFTGMLTTAKLLSFNLLTVDPTNYKKYRWTWCGRYSVPFGLLTAIYLNEKQSKKPLDSKIIHYCNSTDHPVLNVKDIGMGVTAPATHYHWVGYAVIGY